MKVWYMVTAIKNRRVETTSGFVEAEYGYVAHKSAIVASSESDAIELARMYMPINTEYDSIRATYIE